MNYSRATSQSPSDHAPEWPPGQESLPAPGNPIFFSETVEVLGWENASDLDGKYMEILTVNSQFALCWPLRVRWFTVCFLPIFFHSHVSLPEGMMMMTLAPQPRICQSS